MINLNNNPSNLSQLKTDIAFAVKEETLNSSLKRWLDNFDDAPTLIKLYTQPDTDIVETDYSQFETTLGFDPFIVPDGTKKHGKAPAGLKDLKGNSLEGKDLWRELDDNDFMYAFKVKLGLPESGYSDPIVSFSLDRENKLKAKYHMTFKSVQIVALEGHVVHVYDQKTLTKPFVATFNVDLNLDTKDLKSSFNNLPKKVQHQVKNLDQDAFSVQQLYFDLNTAGLASVDMSSITTSGSLALSEFQSKFIVGYAKKLGNSGANILGYSVVHTQPENKPTLTPVDMRLSFWNKNASHPGTLVYLMTTQPEVTPIIAPPSWHFLTNAESNETAGIIGINGNDFTKYLSNLLSPNLSNICFIPQPTTKVESAFQLSSKSCATTFTFGYSTDDNSHNYEINGTSLSFNFDSGLKKSSDYCAIGTAALNARYQVNINITLKGKSIAVDIAVDCFADISVDVFDSKGHILKKEEKLVYDLKINHGKVNVVKNAPSINDKSEDFDTDGILKIADWLSGDELTHVQNWIRSIDKTFANSILGTFESSLDNKLNGVQAFVFPGSETFIFTDIGFSQSGDLLASVNYRSTD